MQPDEERGYREAAQAAADREEPTHPEYRICAESSAIGLLAAVLGRCATKTDIATAAAELRGMERLYRELAELLEVEAAGGDEERVAQELRAHGEELDKRLVEVGAARGWWVCCTGGRLHGIYDGPARCGKCGAYTAPVSTWRRTR